MSVVIDRSCVGSCNIVVILVVVVVILQVCWWWRPVGCHNCDGVGKLVSLPSLLVILWLLLISCVCVSVCVLVGAQLYVHYILFIA